MDSSDEELFLVMEMENEFRKKKKQRKMWIHDICLKRNIFGEYTHLFEDLLNDNRKFFNYFRMTKEKYFHLLELVTPLITKQHSNFRKSVCPEERLMLCLRYLATGDSFKSLSYTFRMGESTVRNIVYSTCQAIWDRLQPIEMPRPTIETWKKIEEEFSHRWNFPNAIGALDGKHIVIQAPPNTGSLYFCYKKTFSVVLLALVAADYKFIIIDVGSYGKNSDGAIFASSVMGKSLKNNDLQLPPDKALPSTNQILPHVIIGDEAFPLSNNIMRPYPGTQTKDDETKRIFNYRLSRARRVSENAFGILIKKFRLYEKRLILNPEHLNIIVMATCVLHNFLREDTCYWTSEEQEVAYSSQNENLTDLPRTGGNSSQSALQIRDKFKNYFNSEEGSVPWQLQAVRAGRQSI